MSTGALMREIMGRREDMKDVEGRVQLKLRINWRLTDVNCRESCYV